jgi:hypothetical protein
MVKQCCLDLCDVDPMTPDIYLKVLPTEVDKTTIRQFTTQISGTINTLVSTFWVGKEYRSSEFRTPPITGGKIPTSHGDLTSAIGAYFFTIRVKQQNLHVFCGVPDRYSVFDE